MRKCCVEANRKWMRIKLFSKRGGWEMMGKTIAVTRKYGKYDCIDKKEMNRFYDELFKL